MIFASRSSSRVAGKNAFDGRLRADRHEDRRFDVAMRGVQNARPRAGGGTDGLEFETKHRSHDKGAALPFSLFLSPRTAARAARWIAKK